MRYILALSFLAISLAARADPPPGTIMKVSPPPDTAQAERMCLARFESEVAALGHLRAMLELTDAQTPLFEEWRKVRVDVAHAWPCPPPPVGLDVPAPRRLENQIAMTAQALDAFRKEQPALKALYDALAPRQRAIFDGPKKGFVPPPGQAPPAPH